MSKTLKISLWIGGIIIAIPVGLILIGFFGAMFGLYNPSASKPANVAATAPQVEIKVPDIKTENIKVLNDVQSTPSPQRIVLPANIQAQDALRWVVENNFIKSQSGDISVEFETFKRLSMEDALKLHALFSKGEYTENIKPSTDATESLKRQYATMRMLVFSGASVLPVEDRKTFAKQSGAVFPASAFDHDRHDAEYVKLFAWHTQDTTGSAETAIREYANVFEDKEMIRALKMLGVISVSKSGSNPNANTRWNIRAGESLAQLQPDTLQAIHDAIKKTIGGDRVKLRRQIRKTIESRHTADDL